METKKGRITATTTIEELGDDLTVQILRLMPLKSIVLCLGVCKRWQSLINDGPFFLTNAMNVSYGHRASKCMWLRRGQRGGGMQKSELSFSVRFSDKSMFDDRIFSSSNGLVFSGVSVRGSLHKFYIFNPWTRECVTFRKPYYISPSSSSGFAIENNPINSISSDNSTNNKNNAALYKIVVVKRIEVYSTYRFGVYSSDKKRWQLLELVVEPHLWHVTLARNSIYCNRVLYWQCKDCKWCKEDHALMLNLEKETASRLDLPPKEDGIVVGRKLTECSGQLHYIRISSIRRRLGICKMSMMRDEWVILDNVELEGAVERNLQLFPNYHRINEYYPQIFKPVDMNCQGDDKVLLGYDNHRIVSYDLKRAEFELVLEEVWGRWNFFRYTPTNKSISKR
ncbi:hypothetical protein MRB53_027644 [Persea americana]|uniref:Uncharacterized protein n=1 Tax=Persea americana TaxID=3435 RepID=A0ACC2LM68_PERAE|nr:hypothetical protein MRB53_027644 [Persea americana]